MLTIISLGEFGITEYGFINPGVYFFTNYLTIVNRGKKQVNLKVQVKTGERKNWIFLRKNFKMGKTLITYTAV